MPRPASPLAGEGNFLHSAEVLPRPVEFDPQTYRRRNIVERLVGWLKESRRVFSRFEKTARNFLAMII
ncbi:MAG TPA: transposase, partial [Thermoguttaceae bacterium]|nr:transposase [Thermoguttaceae bacterium]